MSREILTQRLERLTSLSSCSLWSIYLHLAACKGTSTSVQEKPLAQGCPDTVSVLAAAGEQSPAARTQPTESMLQGGALPTWKGLTLTGQENP